MYTPSWKYTVHVSSGTLAEAWSSVAQGAASVPGCVSSPAGAGATQRSQGWAIKGEGAVAAAPATTSPAAARNGKNRFIRRFWRVRAGAGGDPAHPPRYGVVTATPSNVEVFTVPLTRLVTARPINVLDGNDTVADPIGVHVTPSGDAEAANVEPVRTSLSQ